ncbi:MAG: hypothetical protein A2W83_02760 [Sulfuricurvum sp. RIFCSPLOWO2_12_43_5]|uniref:AAA domain-containing protein n=1 Tax=Candidatus Danuiimicrobium aquiferis TaxID=1801832 RepID=A0A1G1L247_9BACT|nr:MAG: hypothetical protein A3B72_05325 [Omnitrophica bacterium RIFCSPHIGHO2_02_FULL_45_28]OGW89995.1 MAG: hypothetical protein A3E74_03400 [Omnitrophica bacterium RIFCSPHIGHO2_12_FULL_44_12]OGW98959.1 MAG: hypothetical protein A3G33_06455 [Omnitrophica bacterium RIFCSPLOWO2_12_FULL_44_17]OGX04596.1 MAG: hypothetical protein A3J12_06070 [Omnitrophica bacterium RIFCSPLOWO2_02_FULL_44_11]OHD92973.1 MAG: hypothetical protein A2W83_02760 [Sulfuricurvum sp. RIFCSPLOWO2_12_43_5]
MKIFSFCNQKGGVGKTTTAVNLAAALSVQGKKVLLIDMDPQGNATSGVGIDKRSLRKTVYHLLISDMDITEVVINDLETNISVIPANKDLIGASIELIQIENREFLLKNRISSIKDKYDYILIDCPPSLGFITLNALVASDALIIPLQCEYYALEGLSELIETFRIVKNRLSENLEIGGIVMTMADFRTNLTQQVIEEVRKHFKEKVFDTIISRNIKISEAPSFGKSVIQYDPNSKGAQNYTNLAKEFLNRFSPENISSKERNYIVSS